MALFSGERDISMFRHINRELISRISCQQAIFYKVDIQNTKDNMYGESKKKVYYEPVKIDCAIMRTDQTSENKEQGLDLAQSLTFYFLRDDLIIYNLLPQRGDIIMWRENYYEIDNIIENQFIGGKQEEYSLTSDLENFGESWSLACQTHLTSLNRLNIINAR